MTSWRSGPLQIFLLGAPTLRKAFSLFLAGQIRKRPSLSLMAIPGRCLQGEMRIDEMWPRKADKIGATGSEDRVDLIPSGDVSNRHGWNPDLVSYLLGQGSLEHTAIDRLGCRCGLARRNIHDIAAILLQHSRYPDRIVTCHAAVTDPVGR